MTDCDCVLDRVDILPSIEFGNTVRWVFQPGEQIDPAATVRVERSKHATEEDAAWTEVDTVLASVGEVADPVKRSFGAAELAYYRLVIDNPACVSRIYPAYAGTLSCQLRASLKEVIRRERLRHRSGETQAGALLKRKYAGTRCTVCSDPAYPTRVVEPNCDNCYGTGYVGGYFENTDFHVDMGQFSGTKLRGELLNEEVGDRGTWMQYLNIPAVQVGDVWVDYQSDHRWRVETVETILRIGSYVLVQRSKVHRLNFSDVVYRFPRT